MLAISNYDEHKIFNANFLKFGMLYDLLKKLMIGEMNINGENIEQIDLITTNLVIGHNRDILIKGVNISKSKKDNASNDLFLQKSNNFLQYQKFK